MLLGALVFIALGIMMIFNQDQMWQWHVGSARKKGIAGDALERTSEWEQSMTLRGLFFLVCGLLAAAFSL